MYLVDVAASRGPKCAVDDTFDFRNPRSISPKMVE
jgi:hypothetical protein